MILNKLMNSKILWVFMYETLTFFRYEKFSKKYIYIFTYSLCPYFINNIMNFSANSIFILKEGITVMDEEENNNIIEKILVEEVHTESSNTRCVYAFAQCQPFSV